MGWHTLLCTEMNIELTLTSTLKTVRPNLESSGRLYCQKLPKHLTSPRHPPTHPPTHRSCPPNRPNPNKPCRFPRRRPRAFFHDPLPRPLLRCHALRSQIHGRLPLGGGSPHGLFALQGCQPVPSVVVVTAQRYTGRPGTIPQPGLGAGRRAGVVADDGNDDMITSFAVQFSEPFWGGRWASKKCGYRYSDCHRVMGGRSSCDGREEPEGTGTRGSHTCFCALKLRLATPERVVALTAISRSPEGGCEN